MDKTVAKTIFFISLNEHSGEIGNTLEVEKLRALGLTELHTFIGYCNNASKLALAFLADKAIAHQKFQENACTSAMQIIRENKKMCDANYDSPVPTEIACPFDGKACKLSKVNVPESRAPNSDS